MLVSQGAMSSAVASRPRSGPSASAAGEQTSKGKARRRLRIDMRHLAVFADGPAGDADEMVNGSHSAIREQLGTRRLNIARLVSCAALQDGDASVPAPGNAETSQRFRQHRFLKGCRCPAFAAVGRDIHLGDLAIAGPGEPGNLI